MRAGRLGLVLAGLVAAVLAAAGTASAHTRSETHSSWQLNGPQVHLTFTVPDLEVKRLAPKGGTVTPQQVAAYLAPRVYPMSGDKACKRTSGPAASSAEQGYVRFEFEFLCADENHIKVHSSAYFEIVPTHVNFAQIQTAKGEFIEQLFTTDQQTIDVSAGASNPLKSASFFEYIRMGMEHIFTGVDHMSFLIGLVLISRRLKDLVFVITGFTLGHSVTLALAITGILRPHAEYIDALVALTIVLIGAENFAVATRKPEVIAMGLGGSLLAMAALRVAGIGLMPSLLLLGAALFSANYLMVSGHLRDAGRLRMVVTLIFGLIHGFGFASNLMEMKLPRERLGELLLGFNLGVEIGQLSIVLLLTGVVVMLVRMKWSLPRPIVVDLASTYLVGLGTYWFISRSF